MTPFATARVCFCACLATVFLLSTSIRVMAQDTAIIQESLPSQEQQAQPTTEGNSVAPADTTATDPAAVAQENPQQQPASFETLLDQQISTPEGETMPAGAADLESGLIDPNFLKEEGKSFDDYPKVTVQILDKITAQSKSFDLEIGKTVAYGNLRIRPQACKKTPPIEEPESASFLQIWEKKHNGDDEWIFSGWMFASSPSLSAMEHPVYDVWVVNCVE